MIELEIIEQNLAQAFHTADLPLEDKVSGKVRDWFALNDKERLIITTDRLSAFDRVLTKIPFKGQVLNQLSVWWFEEIKEIVQNHIIRVPDPNAMVVKQAKAFPIEVVVRGYITGVTTTSLWYRYELGERDIYGYTFPDGLQKNQKLEKAIITPTTKDGPTGHDERLTCAEVVDDGYLTKEIWEQTMQAALDIFAYGQKKAKEAGLILVDTKYEFGFDENGQLMLIDEVHTPDSSRFWNANTYQERFNKGLEPDNFDKESVRKAFIAIGYRGEGEIPKLDESILIHASQQYIQLYETMTGQAFVPGEYPVNGRLLDNLKKSGDIS